MYTTVELWFSFGVNFFVFGPFLLILFHPNPISILFLLKLLPWGNFWYDQIKAFVEYIFSDTKK